MSQAQIALKTHISDTLKISIPVMIGQLGMVLMGIQDNLMIGWVSHVHLSAAALANSLYIIFNILGIGVASAITPLVSEAIGAGQSQETGKFLKQGVWASIIAGLFIFGLVELLIYFLPYMGQPADEVAMAIPYLRIINLSTVPILIFTAYKQYCDGLNNTKVGMFIMIVGLLLNTILNYGLIFGKWGFPQLDLIGAALATTIVKILMMFAIVIYVHKKQAYKSALKSHSWKFDIKIIAKVLSIGVPIGLQMFFEIAAFAGATVMMGWLVHPDAARAAHQIAMGTASATFMFCSGLATGASVRVGNFYGMRNFAEMKKAALAAIYLCLIIMSICALAFIVINKQLPIWYGVTDMEVAATASMLCFFAAAFQIFDGMQVVAAGILRGRQDMRYPTIVTFFVHWCVSLPLSYILAFVFDFWVYGFWVSFIISLILASVLLTYRVFSLKNE